MNPLELKNQNIIKFSYDHDLPYKKSIRPEITYGVWKEDTSKTLIKINLTDMDLNLIKNKSKISILNLYTIEEELWFNLEDVYLVMPLDKQLKKRVENNNIIVAFLNNNTLINALGF